jgi:hypothetical protein
VGHESWVVGFRVGVLGKKRPKRQHRHLWQSFELCQRLNYGAFWAKIEDAAPAVLTNPATACPDHAPDQSGQAFGLAGLSGAGTLKTCLKPRFSTSCGSLVNPLLAKRLRLSLTFVPRFCVQGGGQYMDGACV